MIELDITAFKALFPQFATTADPLVTAQWGMATAYISADTYGDMPVAARTYCLQLMTAHLLAIGIVILNGGSYTGTPGIVTQSKVGDVSVTLAPPPYGTSQWRYWLSLTPYGLQLSALLDAQSVGGFYVGGLPERAAFRKVAGIW